MEEINVDELDISYNYVIMALNGNSKIINITGNYNLFNFLTDFINKELKAILLDNYILGLKSFSPSEYQNKIQKFEDLYNSGNYQDKNGYEKALEYICNDLLKYDLYVCTGDEAIKISGKNILYKISTIYDNSKGLMDLSNYTELKKLIDYIDYNKLDYSILYLEKNK